MAPKTPSKAATKASESKGAKGAKPGDKGAKLGGRPDQPEPPKKTFHPKWADQSTVTYPGKGALLERLLTEVDRPVATKGSKVTVIGAGEVGMSCAFAILSKRVTTELVIVDVNEQKLKADMLDLQHGLGHLPHIKVSASTDFSLSRNSKIVVVTAGACPENGDTGMIRINRNVDMFRGIIPTVVKHSPGAVLIIASNPVDVLTYVAWKLSGLPCNRVIGSGTNLDSMRFRRLLSQRLEMEPGGVHGWIVGQHGKGSIPVWSGVQAAGIRLADLVPEVATPNDKENWGQVYREVIDSTYDVAQVKGCVSLSAGDGVCSIVRSILHNVRDVCCVSLMVKGYHGISLEVFMSLPCVLGENGVTHVVNQTFSDTERRDLQASAVRIKDVQSKIKLKTVPDFEQTQV